MICRMNRSPIDNTDMRMGVGRDGEPHGRNIVSQVTKISTVDYRQEVSRGSEERNRNND